MSNKEKILTILTPTYNRGGQPLEKLYNSLINQTSKSFKWLVIDDGSTDNTKEQIENYIADNNIEIIYQYKTNGGKHTALNFGLKIIEDELTMIVDSDDYLTSDAVESVISSYKESLDIKEICGFSFLRCFPDGKINGKEFSENNYIASYIETRINANDTHADKAEVFYTRCLKEFPFPEYPGEKFLGEDIVWIRMARKYKMVHINKGIYIGDYLEGGLTNNRRKHNITSPIGCYNRAKEFMKADLKVRYRIKAGLQSVIYGRFAGMGFNDLMRNSVSKGLTVICYIPGVIIYKNWKRKY